MSYEGRVEHLCKNGHHWEHDCYQDCYQYMTADEDGVVLMHGAIKICKCPVCESEFVWSHSLDDTNEWAEYAALDVIGQQTIKCRCCKGTGSQTIQIYKIPPGNK